MNKRFNAAPFAAATIAWAHCFVDNDHADRAGHGRGAPTSTLAKTGRKAGD